MVFGMQLELARARELEGWRVGVEEGPTFIQVRCRKLQALLLINFFSSCYQMNL
jgi:hypothetical protein